MKISNKTINNTIERYNYICSTLRAMGKEKDRLITLNVINDYITILKDERITKNQNNDRCYSLIYTICNELEEYENNNDFVDYYEEETATAVRNNYLMALEKTATINDLIKEIKKLYKLEPYSYERYLQAELIKKLEHKLNVKHYADYPDFKNKTINIVIIRKNNHGLYEIIVKFVIKNIKCEEWEK